MQQKAPARHLSQGRQAPRIKSSIIISALLAGMLGGGISILEASNSPEASSIAAMTADPDLESSVTVPPADPQIELAGGDEAVPVMNKHDVVVTDPVPYGSIYGSIEIPKLGEAWTRPLHEGTGDDVIDMRDALGRTVASKYVNTQPFGSTGITGITGHSGGLYDLDVWELSSLSGPDDESKNFSPFTRLDELSNGDELRIHTAAGTYTYELLWGEKVLPHQNEVLYDQVFRTPEKLAGDEIGKALVLTTCGVLPDWNGDPSIRRAVYFEFKGFVSNQ